MNPRKKPQDGCLSQMETVSGSAKDFLPRRLPKRTYPVIRASRGEIHYGRTMYLNSHLLWVVKGGGSYTMSYERNSLSSITSFSSSVRLDSENENGNPERTLVRAYILMLNITSRRYVCKVMNKKVCKGSRTSRLLQLTNESPSLSL